MIRDPTREHPAGKKVAILLKNAFPCRKPQETAEGFQRSGITNARVLMQDKCQPKVFCWSGGEKPFLVSVRYYESLHCKPCESARPVQGSKSTKSRNEGLR